MIKFNKSCLLLVCSMALFCVSALNAQNNSTPENPWTFISETPLAENTLLVRQIIPQKYKTVQLNLAQFKTQVESAPLRFSAAAELEEAIITLPMPDGSF